MIKIEIEEISKKNKAIDNAIIELKKKYVGIDEQIDEIMNNVRTWYCYPELQERPLVVNLWGMSGCGKTDCVKSIAKLLDIESDLIYFNFADISEKSAWEVQQDIEDNVGNSKSNRMFVYDEFQYAATIDKEGKEKDNKCGLKPFWELLDTGVLKSHPEIKWLSILMRTYFVMCKIQSCCDNIKFSDCRWYNYGEYIDRFDSYEISKINEIFQETVVDESGTSAMELKCHIKERLCEIQKTLYGESYDLKIESIESKVDSMNFEQLMDLFYDTYKEASKGYELTFKNSIIFVIGNLDEAYDVAFNVNPDMSPDQFNKITKKISVVDIKEALEKRFRNEQIARLGNIHVIYPSFTSDTFKKIISIQLNSYAEQVKEKIGCDMEFDKSIHSIIYKEGVFPTHGTRPVFSSIQEIVKTRLPEIIRNIEESGKLERLNKLNYSCKNNNVKVKAFDKEGNKLGETKYKLKLRVESLRDSTCDEFQALCAVHESGHFCVHMNVFGTYPEKLVSKTTDSNTGGFLMQDTDENDDAMKTYNYYFNQIKVALGGYVAEKVVFGKDNRTSGALSDLKSATSIAIRMVRKFGMYEPYMTDILVDSNSRSFVVEDNMEEENKKIKEILKKANSEVEKLFKDYKYRKMLKLSSEYLANHTIMPKNKMEEIYSVIPVEERTVTNDRLYRDAITNF